MLFKLKNRAYTILLIFTISLILVFTLIINENFEFRTTIYRGISLIPFKEIVGIFCEWNPSFYFWQIVLNIILFIPFGFTLSTYLNCHKSTHSLLLTVLLSAFLLSASVEALQYLTSRGFTEVDDVINNTLGAVIGWWGYERVLKVLKK